MSGIINKLGKNIGKNISLLKILKLFFLFLVILVTGYFIGSRMGIFIVSSAISGNKSIFFLYKLPLDYIITTDLLSSESELKRIEGYYSLLDNNIIDDYEKAVEVIE